MAPIGFKAIGPWGQVDQTPQALGTDQQGFTGVLFVKFAQVNMKKAMGSFRRRYPAAAKQIGSVREMQAW